MWYVVVLIVGLLVGGAAGGMFILLRTRWGGQRERTELADRAVAAETRTAELDRLLAVRRQEVESLRGELDLARTARTEAQTRLEAATGNLADQKALLDRAREQLVDVFRSLSSEALAGNTEQFLKLAGETLTRHVEQSRGDLDKRQQAIESMVKPLGEALKGLDEQSRRLESQRSKTDGELRQYLQSVSGTQQSLQAETRKLVAALREPRARGRWGELTLRRVVEVAGMSEHCDFIEQVTADGEAGRLRPDMVIHLPAGRQVVVDAKAPMDAYLDALSADSEPARNAALDRHARQIRAHLAQLSAKRYWEQFTPTPEMVVLFVPGESFFSAALDSDHSLIEDGASQRVILASPTTLIALLRAVSYGWQQEAMARNAEQISRLGRELYDSIRIMAGHLGKLQRSLAGSVSAFNQAVGSFEGRVLSRARRFKELGAAAGEDIDAIEPIDQAPRDLPRLEENGTDRPALPGQEAQPGETA